MGRGMDMADHPGRSSSGSSAPRPTSTPAGARSHLLTRGTAARSGRAPTGASSPDTAATGGIARPDTVIRRGPHDHRHRDAGARHATKAEGVHRTEDAPVLLQRAPGPWPGVTSITKVLDAPALTYWKMNQVAQAAIASAEQLIRDREAGKTDAAVKYLTTLSTTAMDRGSRIHASIESDPPARARARSTRATRPRSPGPAPG